jgi:hypothetical protein
VKESEITVQPGPQTGTVQLQLDCAACSRARSGQASQIAGDKKRMAQNHYSTKPKRRQKNKKRKDTSAGTMAKVRQLEAAEKTK